MRSFLRSKIHRATVTHADVDYEGSLSIDRDLLAEADIAPYEEVHVWNVTRGTLMSPGVASCKCNNGFPIRLDVEAVVDEMGTKMIQIGIGIDELIGRLKCCAMPPTH